MAIPKKNKRVWGGRARVVLGFTRASLSCHNNIIFFCFSKTCYITLLFLNKSSWAVDPNWPEISLYPTNEKIKKRKKKKKSLIERITTFPIKKTDPVGYSLTDNWPLGKGEAKDWRRRNQRSVKMNHFLTIFMGEIGLENFGIWWSKSWLSLASCPYKICISFFVFLLSKNVHVIE